MKAGEEDGGRDAGTAQPGGDQRILSDVASLRRRAREHLSEGAVTASYPLDKDVIVRLLNEALATEIVCVLRYKRHYYSTRGLRAHVAAGEFLEHANEEQGHADQIAERIVQLGEEPDLNPMTLTDRSHAEYHDGTDLAGMLEADLVAERVAIESYREMITYIGDRDPTTRRLLEEILAVEEEHAEDIADLLGDFGARPDVTAARDAARASPGP